MDNTCDNGTRTVEPGLLRSHPSVMYLLIFTAAFLVPLIAGICFGSSVGYTAEGMRSVFTKGASVMTTVRSLVSLTASDLIELAVIFAAGFTLFPVQLCSAVIMYRGLIAGVALSMNVVSGKPPIMGVMTASYFAATVVFMCLAASSVIFSYKLREFNGRRRALRNSRLVPMQLLIFSALGGLIILLKIIPQLILL